MDEVGFDGGDRGVVRFGDFRIEDDGGGIGGWVWVGL